MTINRDGDVYIVLVDGELADDGYGLNRNDLEDYINKYGADSVEIYVRKDFKVTMNIEFEGE